MHIYIYGCVYIYILYYNVLYDMYTKTIYKRSDFSQGPSSHHFIAAEPRFSSPHVSLAWPASGHPPQAQPPLQLQPQPPGNVVAGMIVDLYGLDHSPIPY